MCVRNALLTFVDVIWCMYDIFRTALVTWQDECCGGMAILSLDFCKQRSTLTPSYYTQVRLIVVYEGQPVVDGSDGQTTHQQFIVSFF